MSYGHDLEIEDLSSAEDAEVSLLAREEVVEGVDRGGVGRDRPVSEAEEDVAFFQANFR